MISPPDRTHSAALLAAKGNYAMNGRQPAVLRVTTCGVNELAQHGLAGFTHVLSILDPEEPLPKAIAAFDANRWLELRFHDVIEPGPGFVLAEAYHIEELLRFGREAMASGPGAHLLIHCHAGVSRSTAAAILCLTQAHSSRSAYQALGDVVRMRPAAWPNLRLLELGDAALGRHGEIVAAAGALYRRALDASPNLSDHLFRRGRAREVALADRWR